MRRALLGCGCDVATMVASSSSEESMGADCVTFDEGFRARFGAESVDVGWGLAAALFFAFGGILKGGRVTVTASENVTNVGFGGARKRVQKMGNKIERKMIIFVEASERFDFLKSIIFRFILDLILNSFFENGIENEIENEPKMAQK